ncbi:TIGR03084 family protein [Nocardioides sp. TRM66260-LWL]|uniref:TIGR03084 family metal-binding protein n=1 Tax=Nocardioides sp. TRM66260-LWL TaxID=2874478 RepID=UPI001CC5F524|nr:TIGR03084 family metal-binding protein [Nocardioides sp. TRM66260-LWL]MBZ5735971.1 TIGR03084 family protein [Nocardioides sp. TRM66260-LWL]
MSDLLEPLLVDLAAEGARLRERVAALGEAAWRTPTPAAGWDVATQVAHLLWTDEVAALAARAHTPEGKEAWDAVVLQAFEDPEGFVDAEALRIGAESPAALLARWDAARPALAEALREVPAGQRMPWFGPPMSPTSMATARFMETWAHALDVAEALGETPAQSRAAADDRLRHVAHLAVRTRDFAFGVHGRPAPAEPFRVELRAPSGDTWAYGPEDAAQRVTGSAWDLCLLATQRVHRADTDLVAEGPDAEAWLGIAQCFAGPAGAGRDAR